MFITLSRPYFLKLFAVRTQILFDPVARLTVGADTRLIVRTPAHPAGPDYDFLTGLFAFAFLLGDLCALCG